MIETTTPTKADELCRFLNFCKEASISIINDSAGGESFLEQPVPEELRVLGHWMSVIMLTSGEMRLTFKTHFMSSDGKILTSKSLRKPVENITQDQILDFFKEYCNMVAGKIKWLIEFNGHASGISLPLSMRGFDEVFFPSPDNRLLFLEQWGLKSELTSFVCSVAIEVQNPNLWNTLRLNYEQTNEKGDVDFL